MLRDKRQKQLISEVDFLAAMERLNNEQQERNMDIEIRYADKEARIKEELERIKLESETEQKKILKERQTNEKMMIFKRMID